MKYCTATAAMLGLSRLWIPRVAEALQATAAGKTPIIWLKGQGCKGCAVSLLNSDEPTPGQTILDSFALDFFPLLTAASGDLTVATLNDTATAKSGDYILLVEGSFPLGDKGAFATMGFDGANPLTLEVWLTRLARNAKATLAVGTCAAYGGIPVLFTQADVRTVEAVLGQPTPAIPGCPPHPDWIVGTIVKLLLFGKDALMAGLDGERRPKEFYGQLVHDNCPRRSSFDSGIFVEKWNDNVASDNACLLTKGCRGPLTHADCPLRRWNQRINWCIGAGAPCNGCTEPAFYAGLSPLFDVMPSAKLPGTRPMGVSPEAVGATVAAATAIGLGAHLVARVARSEMGKPRRAEKAESRGPAPGEALQPAQGDERVSSGETPADEASLGLGEPAASDDRRSLIPTGYFGPERRGTDGQPETPAETPPPSENGEFLGDDA